MFMALAPGTVVGLGPWWLTGWRGTSWWPPAKVLGGALVLAGGLVLVQAFARFVVEGLGTPAPVAPTEHLVVGGLYRYVRNPMYLAVVAGILGQALLFGRLVLVVYAVLVAALIWAFGTWYEEPALARRFGAEYEQYRNAVPGWRPRLHPWTAAGRRQRGSRRSPVRSHRLAPSCIGAPPIHSPGDGWHFHTSRHPTTDFSSVIRPAASVYSLALIAATAPGAGSGGMFQPRASDDGRVSAAPEKYSVNFINSGFQRSGSM